MENVSLVAYKFPIGPLGLKEEIHTEIRVFGCDFWFENRGAKSVKSRNKEKIPYDGCDYTLFKIIDCGVTTVSQQQFFLFLERIAQDHTSEDYKLFTKNCRAYSKALLNNSNPSQSREAHQYLDSLIGNQNFKSNLLWGLTGAATGKNYSHYFKLVLLSCPWCGRYGCNRWRK